MSQIMDRPGGITLEEDMLGGFGGFPDKVFLIHAGGDKYAANNATLTDGQTVDGLATFPDPDEATTYMGLLAGLNGDVQAKTFEEARQIAISKPTLKCLFLFRAGVIADVHWIR